MNKREKHKRNRKEHHKKAQMEHQVAQSDKTQSENIVEPESSMIQTEIEHHLMDTHSQQSFFEPHCLKDKAWIGLGPLGSIPHTGPSLRNILREQRLRHQGSKVHWKAVKYEEGHLHPGSIIREKEIIPPDRE